MRKKAILLALLGLFATSFVRTAAAQKEPVDAPIPNPDANIAGTYSATIHEGLASHAYETNKNEKLIKEMWTFKQEGKTLTGTEKTAGGELPLKGTIRGNTFHGVVTDGDKHYTVALTFDPSDNTMVGSIRIGIHEYMMTMAKAK